MKAKTSFWNEEDEQQAVKALRHWWEMDETCNEDARSLTMLDRADHPVYYWAWSNADNPDFDPRTGTFNLMYRVFRSTDTTKGVPLTEPMSRAEAIAKYEQIIKLTRED